MTYVNDEKNPTTSIINFIDTCSFDYYEVRKKAVHESILRKANSAGFMLEYNELDGL